MSGEVKVQKHLDFRNGRADHYYNVLGNMNRRNVVIEDFFTGIALDTTNTWAVTVPGTSDSIAISEVSGGSCLITTGTADDDSCMLASAIIFDPAKNPWCEFDLTITDITGTALFAGFSDAKSESNNSIAIHYPDDVLTTVASDVAGFVVDADTATLGASSIIAASSQAVGGDTTPVDSGIDWADNANYVLRVELDSDGKAYYYLWEADGTKQLTSVAGIASSVTSGTLMCVTVQAMTRAGDGSNTVRVHSAKAGQGR